MDKLRALVFWNDNTYYPVLLENVKEPRKGVDDYIVGEKVISRLHGYKGEFEGEIIAISSK